MHETAAACPSCGGLRPPAQRKSSGLANYFSLNDRIGRQTYWLQYMLPIGFGGAILGLILDHFHLFVLNLIVTLVCWMAFLAGGVKRCHDRGRSGWFQLIGVIPLIGWIWIFVELGCLRGTPGPNRFGPDPIGHQYRAFPQATV
jgi:uncharacterized membrane protein YhaH (DUF805 family)